MAGVGKRHDQEVKAATPQNKPEGDNNSNDGNINEARNSLQELKNTLYKQNAFIGQYRGSIVFPLYKITSSFGKTPIGQALQKLKSKIMR